MAQAGSLCDKVDYDIDNFVAYAGIDVQLFENLNLFADVSYTWTKAEGDNPHFGNPWNVITDHGGTPEDPHPSYTGSYDPWFVITYTNDMDDMKDWYDLEYEIFEVSGGFQWDIFKNLSLKTVATYRNFDDKEEYLYEDNDGEMYIINTSLIWRF
ncbi:hypothetical protein TST_0611 [Thermosulfidibacter takaii ABI70S6]|uniref:Uncharacterized protein n=1 Tax=Thermosulfidibacter takaii (strain DSM 17441 / JCM 13301 / NBRC 103674 / ABI70S6) TaxID=1298851 RepID=A0A0S3QSW6_THET7|nr:hypothetical protein TST_0611 [Thermosulfidibacter takaii ABI70S6]